MPNHVKYYFSLQHLEKYDDESVAKVSYERFISAHDTLDDAIKQLKEYSILTDPSIKNEMDEIVNNIHTHETEFNDSGYRICFSQINDAKKFYFGPGAYAITREMLS